MIDVSRMRLFAGKYEGEREFADDSSLEGVLLSNGRLDYIF